MAEAPAEDLDALIKRVDPDRWLSSRFVGDPQKRADIVALYAFDYELRRAAEATTNPLMAEIRLTWWSEVLDEIYGGRQVRRHLTAQALEQAVHRRDLPREPLDEAVEAWLRGASAEAAVNISEASALVLDPQVERKALRAAAAGDRPSVRRVSTAAFPAIAHVALTRGAHSALGRRLRLTWAVLTGRI